MKNLMLKYPLASFLTITFSWSWLFWMTLFSGTPITTLEDYTTRILLIIFAGAFGPTVAALVMTSLQSGWQGLRALLSRLFLWRVNIRWYAILVLPFLMWFITAQVVGLSRGMLFTFTGSLALLVQALLAGLIGGPIAEEIGWRGWLLPHLQQRHKQGLIQASVIVGLVWAAWHIPTFFLPGIALGIQETGMLAPMARYFMIAVAMSIICGWVSYHTQGSLMIDMLLHAAFNASGTFMLNYLQPDAYELFGLQLPWVNMLLWWIVASVIIYNVRSKNNARSLSAEKVSQA